MAALLIGILGLLSSLFLLPRQPDATIITTSQSDAIVSSDPVYFTIVTGPEGPFTFKNLENLVGVLALLYTKLL